MLNQNEERLQKVLAHAGIASRRACEELIEAGRVRVNGKVVTKLGLKVDPAQDKVTVDDHPVPIRASQTPAKVYLLLNKPAGYLSTVTDPQGRPTIMDLIETDQRLYPVGRLDMDTEGLLILTNDGAFANTLMHPRYGLEKEYLALLDGIVPVHELERLRGGVPIPVENDKTGEREFYTTQPARVEIVRNEGSNTLVRFVIKEGKKRQIRLMAHTVQRSVLELKRVSYGPLHLGNLALGKYRPLSNSEIKILSQAASQQPEISKKPGSRPAIEISNSRSRPPLTGAANSNKPLRRSPNQSGKPVTNDSRADFKHANRSQPAQTGPDGERKRPAHSQPKSFDENSAGDKRPFRSQPAPFEDNDSSSNPRRPNRSRPFPFGDTTRSDNPRRPNRGQPGSQHSSSSRSPAGPPAKRGNFKPGRPAPASNRRSPKSK